MTKKVLFLDPASEVSRCLGNLYSIADMQCDGRLYFNRKIEYFHKYNLVACIHINDPFNFHVMLKCFVSGIKTAIYQDGLYEWQNSHKNPKHLCMGRILYDPAPSANLFVAGRGAECYLSYRNRHASIVPFIPDNMTVRQDSICENLSSGGGQVLFTSAKTAYFDECEKQRLIRLYKKLIDAAKELGVSFKFRVFDADLIDILGIPANDNLTLGSFNDVCKGFRVIVTGPSSVMYNVLVMRKALVVMDYRDCPHFFESGWRVHESVDILQVLESAIRQDPERMTYQEYLLEKNFSGCNGMVEGRGVNSEVVLPDWAKIAKENSIRALESPFTINLIFFKYRFLLLLRALKRSIFKSFKYFYTKFYKVCRSLVYIFQNKI